MIFSQEPARGIEIWILDPAVLRQTCKPWPIKLNREGGEPGCSWLFVMKLHFYSIWRCTRLGNIAGWLRYLVVLVTFVTTKAVFYLLFDSIREKIDQMLKISICLEDCNDDDGFGWDQVENFFVSHSEVFWSESFFSLRSEDRTKRKANKNRKELDFFLLRRNSVQSCLFKLLNLLNLIFTFSISLSLIVSLTLSLTLSLSLSLLLLLTLIQLSLLLFYIS